MKKIPLILSLSFAVVSLVYGWVQHVHAERNAEEALRQVKLAAEAKIQADQNAAEARRQEGMAAEQRRVAEQAMEEARRALATAQEELAKCRKKR